jgi:hypothetical protein
MVEQYIEVEEDYFSALQILHPAIYQYTIGYLRKQQRKIDTYELKAGMPGQPQAQVDP